MVKPYLLRLALTYISARQDNRFINFISLISIVGITLGITVLITVLSIMNGFQTELRDRILGMTSHMSIFEQDNKLNNWQDLQTNLMKHPDIISVSPNISAQALVSYDKEVKGIQVKGILPELEKQVSQLVNYVKDERIQSLKPDAFNIILGTELARHLGIQEGDKITLITPQVGGGIVGSLPRLKRFTVSGILDVGMHQYDSAFALIHLDDAAKFYRTGDAVSQVQVKTKNLFDVDTTLNSLQTVLPENGAGFFAVTWQQQHSNFFQAIQLEKRIMFIIIALIIAVATFNIVSTMVMVVNEKKSTIAILRTQGATQKDMVLLFFSQGVIIGLLGTIIGVLVGVLFSLNIDLIVPAIESLFDIQFFPADVYYISSVPSDLQAQDIILVAVFSFICSIIATLYPAWHSSRIQPAEILRHF